MTRNDDELDDRELPDESDMDDSDEPELIRCPSCGKMISEDTEWCHHCGWYLERDAISYRVSYWIVGIVAALILIAILWQLR